MEERNQQDVENETKDGENNLVVPTSKILKIMQVMGIKQSKDSCIYIQKAVESIMDDFIGKLAEIKRFDKKQKVSEEDIRDLILRDNIEYLKEILKD